MFHKHSQVSNSDTDNDLSLLCTRHPSLLPPSAEHRTSKWREVEEGERRENAAAQSCFRQTTKQSEDSGVYGEGKVSVQVRFLDCLWVLFIGFPTKYN